MSTSESSSSTSSSTTTSNSNTPKLYVGTGSFTSSDLSLIGAFMDGTVNRVATSEDALDMEYDALFSPTNVVDTQAMTFTFQFPRSSNMNPEMYSAYPETNATYLTYPVHLEAGIQGEYLFFNLEVDNLYGSPYGNSSNRGNNQLTLYVQIGHSVYGFGEDNDMLPGTFGQDDYARYTNGMPEISSYEGYNLYGYQNFALPNQTYYLGPENIEHPYGNYSYNNPTSFPGTGFFWAGSEILGNSSQPMLTRYLFVLNASAVYPSQSPNLGLALFSLQTNNPFPLLIGSTGSRNFMTLIDNYPSHSITAPFDHNLYMQLEQQSRTDAQSNVPQALPAHLGSVYRTIGERSQVKKARRGLTPIYKTRAS